jgi:hypothetical protein
MRPLDVQIFSISDKVNHIVLKCCVWMQKRMKTPKTIDFIPVVVVVVASAAFQ